MNYDNDTDYRKRFENGFSEFEKNTLAVSENSSVGVTLDDILSKISSVDLSVASDDEMSKVVDLLAQFYYPGTRHSYAEIFIFLSKLQQSNGNVNEQLETIDNNLAIIKKYIDKNLSTIEMKYTDLESSDVDLRTKFFKLRDHILLETARIKFWYMNHNTLEQDIRNLTDSIDESNTKADEIKNITDDALDEVSAFRTTQVTILTVFIAILLMVVTDIKFSVSILSEVGNIPFYQVISLIAFGGLVLLNLSFALLAFIGRIIGKEISIGCNQFKENVELRYNKKEYRCEHCNESCWPLTRWWKRYPYMCVINIILILILVTNMIMVHCSWFTK